jgi:hypothetical protein
LPPDALSGKSNGDDLSRASGDVTETRFFFIVSLLFFVSGLRPRKQSFSARVIGLSR